MPCADQYWTLPNIDAVAYLSGSGQDFALANLAARRGDVLVVAGDGLLDLLDSFETSEDVAQLVVHVEADLQAVRRQRRHSSPDVG